MNRARKKRAPTPVYVSPNQLSLECFHTPFEQHLNKKNRWVVLAELIPWDEICNLYLKHVGVAATGRPAISPRVVIGSLIIKHMCNLDDRETVDQISENMYMQYFLGYSSFTPEAPFDASLFVEFRKRLGMDSLNAINEKIIALKTKMTKPKDVTVIDKDADNDKKDDSEANNNIGNKGRVIYDATACPQDIAYPTDLDLFSDAREKSEQLIDILYDPSLHKKKPRTYRKVARKSYLHTAQKKNKRHKTTLSSWKPISVFEEKLKIHYQSAQFLLHYTSNPKDYKYLLVINFLYQQQKQMYDEKTHLSKTGLSASISHMFGPL